MASGLKYENGKDSPFRSNQLIGTLEGFASKSNLTVTKASRSF
ncbi:hypothetical protein LEP1GSC175_3941 [Leptospira santarosai str. HAI821]|nr:hypothetical protein LEP1GSC175_3941 [Leptospira santarosai str. HAI821]